MTTEKLKALLNTNPFRPLNLYLPSGKSVIVPYRDSVAISPSGRTLVVLGEDESETIVDVLLLERVEMQSAS